MEKRKNGFTLIELIAVLVILAILAIIVTPIVLNIVKNVKDAANKRSVDAYGKTVELSVATYMLDNGEYPTCQSDLKIEYSGNEVNCNIMNLNENGSVYLSECTVGGKEVKDSKTDDGWYHYGKEVVNKVAIYKSYNIGDVIEYNGMNFYVIAESDKKNDSVTLLKAEPLTVDEVNNYGFGHVNMYNEYYTSASYYQTTYDFNGYGGMAYYTSETCGYSRPAITAGCTTDYAKSEIKFVVDSWAKDKLKISDLKTDNLGYKVRLITYEELINNLGFEQNVYCTGACEYRGSILNVPAWVFGNYWYWTMSPESDSNDYVWYVIEQGLGTVYSNYSVSGNYKATVRPVINLYKQEVGHDILQKNDSIINLKC